MMPGRFIAFEGGEGMGKSTQARLLAEFLRGEGRSVELTREPGGTPGAEAIRELLLSPPGEGWTLGAEALLFAAARADHVARKIRPAIEAGDWVICDRFLDSSRAYQGRAGGMGDDRVRTLHEIGSGGLVPDVTVVIDAPIGDVAARLVNRDGEESDAIGGRAAEYHASVNAAFLEFARAEPDRFAIVDGRGSVEEVHEKVLDALSRFLGTP
ncbi:dTMP kinase [Erythrobacter aureus]|uniref:Thymidylate kinase n=1 Tax=Erythrobacter aureus TaxID=2182384 RepID=A0A345YF98_9SPHN|nr:dTMP kinase [Erythrobacter aureus]AXK42600.1 dTMP kinase [Erythrobacter aureus]